MRRMARTVFATALLACAAIALAACGDDGISEGDLERERADAAQNARQQAEIEGLKRELREQKQESTSAGGLEPAPVSGSGTGQLPGDARYCGSAYGAGTASCPFVENVSDDYYASGQSGSFVSYSPTTGLNYTVTCNGDDPAVCTAGRGAVIYIP
jgi:membrane protein involved in colicin uptake